MMSENISLTSYNLSTDNMRTFDNSCADYVLDSLQHFMGHYSNIHGYVAAVICVGGIVANLANIIVLSQPRMSTSPVNFLLTIIAIAEMSLMVIYLPMAIYFYIVKSHPDKLATMSFERSSAVYLYVSTSMVVVCHSIAVWHTIAVATFRWLTLGLSNGPSYSTMRNARICSVVLVVANSLLSIANWVTQEVDSFVSTDCHYTNITIWGVGGKKELTFNNWLFACFGKIFPALLLTGLTIPLVNIMRTAERRRQHLLKGGKSEESRRHQEHNRTTGMLLAVVIIFLVIELPHGIYIICMKDSDYLMNIYSSMGDFIDSLTLVAFSINFIFYTVMSRQFRTTFISLFCKSPLTRQVASFRRVSTILTSLKLTTAQKHSNTYSNGSCNSYNLRQEAADYNHLHPSASPLLTEDNTNTTSLGEGHSGSNLHVV